MVSNTRLLSQDKRLQLAIAKAELRIEEGSTAQGRSQAAAARRQRLRHQALCRHQAHQAQARRDPVDQQHLRRHSYEATAGPQERRLGSMYALQL